MAENFRKNTRFMDVLQHFLNRGLQNWVGIDLDKEAMEGMYEYIKHTVHDVFSKSSLNFTSNAKDWIAQEIYLTVKVGKPQTIMNPESAETISVAKVFDNPADITKIPNDELRMIGSLMSDCEFAYKIAEELKRRR